MKALLAIDESAKSALAVDTAAALAWPAGSQVIVLTVLPNDAELFGGPWGVGLSYNASDEIRGRIVAAGQALVDRGAASVRRPGLEVEARLARGRAATVIVDVARDVGVDMVILGAIGHGAFEQALLGSVSAEVVDQAHCAVLVARTACADRILIGTDGSDVAGAAVEFVGASGLFSGAETRVLHAIDLHPSWWLGFTPGDASFGDEAYMMLVDDARRHGDAVTSGAATLLQAHGLTASTMVHEGPPASVILDEARRWRADLVVIGMRGQGLLKRLLLGSTARTVLHHAGESVLITPATAGIPRHQAAASAAPAEPVHA